MSKTLKILLALKAVLALGGGGAYYYYTLEQNDVALKAKAAATPQPTEEEDTKEGDFDVPKVPKGEIGLAEALKVRNQLELIRSDVISKIAKLNSAKQAYDKAKEDVDAKLKKVEEERKLLDETILKEKTVKQERLSEALEFVSKMDPKKAAPMIESMDRDLVLHLLRKMPQTQVTKILQFLSPQKAAEYLEYYTKIRSGREYELMKELGLCLAEEPGKSEKSLNETTEKLAMNPSSASEAPVTSSETPGAEPAVATPAASAAPAQ